MTQQPKIFIRCYPSQWNNHWRANFQSSGWTPNNPESGCPITGFFVCESYPNVDLARQKACMDSMRSFGFAAIPGMIWNQGSEIADPYQKWKSWTDPTAWANRVTKARYMTAESMRDPRFPWLYLDLELYDSAGQEHANWSEFLRVYKAACAAWSLELTPVVLTQYYEGFPQNMAFARYFRSVRWVEEKFWNLPYKDWSGVMDDVEEMCAVINMFDNMNRIRDPAGDSVGGWFYQPQTMQDIARDYAAETRRILATCGIGEVFSWASSRPIDDDINDLGKASWHSRPKEPIKPPDPAAYGLMAFDVDPSNWMPGSITHFFPMGGTVLPEFKADKAALVMENGLSGQRVLRFDGTLGQGFRSNLGRQLSADYTLYFVGVPPSWRHSNDGTGWQLGQYRFAAQQSPSARWLWGPAWLPADENARHVIVCEQLSNGELRMLIDGVQAGAGHVASNQPDGTMAIGNNDSLSSRPVKMDLERMTVFEGVDRAKSLALSREYCQWYGIRWRGAE